MSETARAGAPAVVTPADALRRFAREVFVRAGMPAAHAATVADVLVWADLRGVEGHGVSRIPRYLEMIAAGDLDPGAAPVVTVDTVASVLIDAGRAAGPIAMTAAMQAAVGKAREASVGLALVRGTTHTAALGYYTLAAARAGMAAIALAGSVPMMAYHGAHAVGLATNPISIAVPGAGEPLLLDMATSAISMGRLLQARRTGQPLPAGAALDRNGHPTTDARAAELPLPLGGPKGSGLSLMIECLTSLVVANPIIAGALEGAADGRRHRQNGLALAIDVARFCDPASFQSQVRRLVAALKSLPHDPDIDLLMPGERGSRALEQRTRGGIPIPRAVFDALESVAERLGVPMFTA
ncbi:MAG: Ldh family oxidoreductase [Candidatus Rokuibacteriota bacterium]